MFKLIQKARKNQKGFTLVELMVVVVIIGILVAIAMPIMNNVQRAAAQRAHDANLRTIEGAIMMYYAEFSDWPEEIDDLDEYVDVAALTVPEILELDDYYLTDDDIPKAAPGGDWEGAFNKEVE